MHFETLYTLLFPAGCMSILSTACLPGLTVTLDTKLRLQGGLIFLLFADLVFVLPLRMPELEPAVGSPCLA